MIFASNKRLEIGVPTTAQNMYVGSERIDPQPVVPIREVTIVDWLKHDRDFRATQGRPWPGDDRMAMAAELNGYRFFYEVTTD